jgi:hypothetical protein
VTIPARISGEIGLAGLVLHRRLAVVSGREPGAGQSSVYTEYHERILNVVDLLAVEKVRSIDETLIAIRGIVNVGRALGGRPAGQSRSAWRRSVPSPF